MNEKEKKTLKKIQNITKNFVVEYGGTINFTKGTFQFRHIGTAESVQGIYNQQFNFHNHPSNGNWKYGGPPSYEDYYLTFNETQRTDFVIGSRFVYCFSESHHANPDLSLAKLEVAYDFYIELSQALENNKIDIPFYEHALRKGFDLIVTVIEL